MSAVKVAIIVRRETLDKCTGKGCLRALFQRRDAFADYDGQAQLVAFTQDGGELEQKIAKLKQLEVDVVHLSSCLRGKSPDYAALAARLSQDFTVVGYTHGALKGPTREALNVQKQQDG